MWRAGRRFRLSNSMLDCGLTTPQDYPEKSGFAPRRERECGHRRHWASRTGWPDRRATPKEHSRPGARADRRQGRRRRAWYRRARSVLSRRNRCTTSRTSRIAPSRKRAPETRPTCRAAASMAGSTSELLWRGASGYRTLPLDISPSVRSLNESARLSQSPTRPSAPNWSAP